MTHLVESIHRRPLGYTAFLAGVFLAFLPIHVHASGGFPDVENWNSSWSGCTFSLYDYENNGLHDAGIYSPHVIQAYGSFGSYASPTASTGYHSATTYNMTGVADGSYSWIIYSDYASKTVYATNQFTVSSSGTVCTPEVAVGISTLTRITSVTPPNGNTFSTSSVPFLLQVTGYINFDDYVEGMIVNGLFTRVTPYNNLGSIDSSKQGGGSFTFTATSSGLFTFSTSSSDNIKSGAYKMRVTLSKPIFSLLGVTIFSKTIVATSTVFSIGTTSPQDWNVLNTQEQIALGPSATNTISYQQGFSADCNPLSFNVDKCFIYLVVPQDEDISLVVGKFRDAFLTRWPWGYATRFVDIATGNATTSTTTLPHLTLSSPAVVQGQNFPIAFTFDLDIFGNLLGPGSILSTATDTEGDTFREVAETDWNLIWSILTIVSALFIVLGVQHHPKSKSKII